MKIINLRLLASFTTPGLCEFCGKYCRRREAHHIFTRASGRLDIPINLIALGSTRLMQCRCHQNAGRIGKAAFLAIVAEREQTTVEAIIREVYRLRRLPQPRTGDPVLSLGKRPKQRSAWQVKAGLLRRAAARAAYQRWKQWRKGKR